jgi:glycosyltransferase involved in cell wall biosynthesis
MKIAIDLQGLQTESRFRGVGRYTYGLTQGLIANKGENEIVLIANRSEDTFDNLVKTFSPLKIVDWKGGADLRYGVSGWRKNREAAVKEYVSMLSQEAPDVLVIPSYLSDIYCNYAMDFESIACLTRLAVVIYDFLPYENPDRYLGGTATDVYANYKEHFEKLKFADYLLAISDYVADKTRELFPNKCVTSILSDTTDIFRRNDNGFTGRLAELGLRKGSYFLYTGGSDERKNVDFLISTYLNLPEEVKTDFPLVVVLGKNGEKYKELYGLQQHLFLLDYIADEDLVTLYSHCGLFIFPSLEEGFGLTVLEAMRCEAPVIAANTTSLPEVVGWNGALFDPKDSRQLRDLMLKAVQDEGFKLKLKENALVQNTRFSWSKSAKRVFSTIKE